MILRLGMCLFTLLFVVTTVISQEKLSEPPSLPKGVVNVGDPAMIKAVLAREEDFRQAYKKLDAKLVADLYADDFLQLTSSGCCVTTKEAQVKELIKHRDAEKPFPISSITDERVVVRVHGNTAVVTGVQTLVGSFPTETPVRTVTARVLFMNVWALENGKWLIVGRTNRFLQ